MKEKRVRRDRRNSTNAPSLEFPLCINCQKTLRNETEFSQKLKVCPECLQIYALIDQAVNRLTEQKLYTARIERLTKKLIVKE